MKKLFVTLTLLFASLAAAQTQSQRIADQIAPLLNETVAAVIHVDLQKIDLDRLDAKLRPLLLANIDRLDITMTPDRHNEMMQSIDKVKTQLEKPIRVLKTQANVRDLYVLVVPSLLPGSCGYIATPLKDVQNTDLLFDPKLKEKVVFENFFITPLQGFIQWEPKHTETALRQIASQKATPRPEFLTALQAVEGSAVQVVLIPSTEMKRVFTEMVDSLPPPLERTSPAVLTRGINWGVLAADPEKIELKLLVRSEQPQAARELYDAMRTVLEYVLDQNKENAAYTALLDAMKIGHEEIVTIAKSFLPQPQGDRLEFVVNEAVVKEKGKRFLEIPAVLVDVAQIQARRMQCTNNLKQLGLALHNHHDVYRKLPATHTVDKDGKPLHSWRLAVLPFLEQVDLYNKIRKDEPWDSEYNKQFHNQCPAVFQCPEMVSKNPDIRKNGLTTYSVIVGKNAWPEGEKKYDFQMMTDGTSNTIAIVERKTSVCWMDPTQEITQEEAEKGINKTESGLSGPHATGKIFGMNTCFFDGSVRIINETVKLEILRALITRNGGE
ncbi:MAG: DUF1559 domain-containing protein [Planctomycetaceae bacterium]|nr:DUF1559 domain-containing protein [Planctomycetaceae bacterium]